MRWVIRLAGLILGAVLGGQVAGGIPLVVEIARVRLPVSVGGILVGGVLGALVSVWVWRWFERTMAWVLSRLAHVSLRADLQRIADPSDTLRRNRGRRGLDVLHRLQQELQAVQIVDDPKDGGGDVDSALVALAKSIRGWIVTNDFNLNKVAELQGIRVLNINELSQALRPVVLPGEELTVQVIKDGKEAGQGVGYLDDGTMVVVEGGKKHIGEASEVVVTSVLQTVAGRMIFGRPKEAQGAPSDRR